MGTKYEPLNGYVIAKLEEKRETAGGIQLPDGFDGGERIRRGTVEAVGRGLVTDTGFLIEPPVKVGDKIIIGGYEFQYVDRDNGLVAVEGRTIIATLVKENTK